MTTMEIFYEVLHIVVLMLICYGGGYLIVPTYSHSNYKALYSLSLLSFAVLPPTLITYFQHIVWLTFRRQELYTYMHIQNSLSTSHHCWPLLWRSVYFFSFSKLLQHFNKLEPISYYTNTFLTLLSNFKTEIGILSEIKFKVKFHNSFTQKGTQEFIK